MSWPTADISVERVRPAVKPQEEFEPRRTVRSHEVRSYGKTTATEWFFLITGLLLVAAWFLLLIAVFAAAVA